MIRSILVTTSGSSSDISVFATAIAAARPLGAHLDFYHVYLTAGEAACHAPHFDFARGPGVVCSLRDLHELQGTLSCEAKKHFLSFCESEGVRDAMQPTPAANGVTATYTEEVDRPAQRILSRARRNDLIVFGRSKHLNCLPMGLFEDTLMSGLRPILIAPDGPPAALLDTVLVAWNRSTASERALTASLPLLRKAARVVVLEVGDIETGNPPLDDVREHLSWHGIHIEPRFIKDRSARALSRISQVAIDIGASMIVMGGYGHSPVRETIWGGVSSEFIAHADVPIFMMH